MGKIVANKSLKMDAKQLACAHSSLILANNFAPVSEALATPDKVPPFAYKNNSFSFISVTFKFGVLQIHRS